VDPLLSPSGEEAEEEGGITFGKKKKKGSVYGEGEKNCV